MGNFKSKLNTSKDILNQPILIIGGLIVIAIFFYNFTFDNTDDCPVLLSYDEVSESIALNYCRKIDGSYQISVSPLNQTLSDAQLRITINEQSFTKAWKDASFNTDELPSYVLIALVYENTCNYNNTTDVSFPIKYTEFTDCESGNLLQESIEELDEVTIDLDEENLITSTKNKSKPKIASNNNTSTKPKSKKLAKPKQESKSRSKSDMKGRKDSEKVEVIRVPATKRSSAIKEIANNVRKVEPVSAVHNIQKQINTDQTRVILPKAFNEDHLQESKITKVVANTNSVVTSVDKKTISGSLFNPENIGIERSCVDNSAKFKSKTDLFIITLKPEQKISLHDIHCFASTSSEMTVTLSQIGQEISSFDVVINKGENQIGLGSLGILDAEQAYLLECRTTNKGDLFEFDGCEFSHNSSQEIVVRYLDNHSSLYDLTYENEI